MCGICGILRFDRHEHVDGLVLHSMNARIAHRGPDDSGCYLDQNLGLGMRRLSIIDLQTGHQPLSNDEESLHIVFNGEIYNHRQLREFLERRGYRYRTQSDTETILHLYEEFGIECVSHLRGMFAFAIWDSDKRVLLLARDRFGIKPLYYARTRRELLFASEIKALLAHPDLTPELNYSSLPEYLSFGYLSQSQTLFDGIVKLPPGHVLQATEDGMITTNCYWELRHTPELEWKPERYYVDTYRNLLEEAVRIHLISDVPVGMFLSGGLDSSAVAAIMTKLRGGPIATFSVGYDEKEQSELPYAELAAKHVGAVHHEVRVSKDAFFSALPNVIWHEDEPPAWPSSVSLYFVAQLAQQYVKVVLTGEGSDETLAGYTRYAFTVANAQWDRVYRAALPANVRATIRAGLLSCEWIPRSLQRKLHHTFLARDGSSWPSFYFDNFYSGFSESEQQDLLLDKSIRAPGSCYRSALELLEASSGDLLHKLLLTDIKTYLVELLMKQDNVSMAASVESRVPFLDHPLAEFAMSIPSQYNIRGLAGKNILKAAVSDLLPASIINRRKMGFPTPWRAWLDGPAMEYVQQVLGEPRTVCRKLFNPDGIRQMLAEHRSRRHDHADRIWRLLNLELWQRIFLDGEALGTIASSSIPTHDELLQFNTVCS